MFKWKKEETKTTYWAGGNVCPPAPPRGTTEELAWAAEKYTDIVDKAMDLLEQARELVNRYDVAAAENLNERWAGVYPFFPSCGEEVNRELAAAQAAVIAASRLVAVQGYSAERRLKDAE